MVLYPQDFSRRKRATSQSSPSRSSGTPPPAVAAAAAAVEPPPAGAGDALASVPDFAQAVRKSAPADAVRLEFLRLTPDGIFVRQVVTVPGGPLGVGVMPI